MKKLLFVIVYIFVIQVVYAQQTDKNFILGGSMNFLIQENPTNASDIIPNPLGIDFGLFSLLGSKYRSFSIKPYLAQELNQRLLLGLQLDCSFAKYTERYTQYLIDPPTSQPIESEIKANSTRIGVGVFSRYTLNPENIFRLFIQPYLKYIYMNSRYPDLNFIEQYVYMGQDDLLLGNKRNSFEVGVGLGAMYCFNDRIRATLTIGGIRYERGIEKRSLVNGSSAPEFEEKESFSSFGTNINAASVFFGIEFRW